MHSEVVIVDSIRKSELITLVKNWGGLTYVNLKEVLVSETENQLVFNYITSNSGGSITSSTYVRLVIMLKVGRIKALFFDEGNVAAMGYPARTYYFTSSFPTPQVMGTVISKVSGTKVIVGLGPDSPFTGVHFEVTGGEVTVGDITTSFAGDRIYPAVVANASPGSMVNIDVFYARDGIRGVPISAKLRVVY